ncbi:MAG: cation transporter [Coriobacteriia bacterium]|nr:cation transporter [Coriobacteriia bacterium]
MKKRYSLENLGCANCAAHMEADINKLADVKSAKVAFMTQKLVIEADPEKIEEVLDAAQRIITSYEKDCIIKR